MSKNTSITIDLEGFSHIQKLRIQWIVDHLIKYGIVRRNEVCRAFSIGTATVTSDFNRLHSRAPSMMTYDKSLRAYTISHVKVKLKGAV